jgi:hypothetical protein
MKAPSTNILPQKMAALTVASRANLAITLPAILAAAYLVHEGSQDQMRIRYEDVESLGSAKEKLQLVTDTGDRFVDDAVMHYFRDHVRFLGRAKRDHVSSSSPRHLAGVQVLTKSPG